MLLVTGASGFIGKALLASLLPKYKVRCLVRDKRTVSLKHKNLQVLQGSLTDEQFIEKALVNVTAIIHLAAITDPLHKAIFSVNAHATKLLVQTAKKRKVKHFIFISTENVLYPCKDAYTQTKLAAESVVKTFKKHTILREPIVYGPGDTKYIGKLIAMIKRYPFIPIPGNGKQTLQPVYIDDLVFCIKKALTAHIFGTYTVVGKQAITYEAIVDTIMEASHIKKMKVHIPFFLLRTVAFLAPIFFIKPPLTNIQLRNLSLSRKHDISLIKKRFKYTPLSFAQGLKQMLKSEHL